MNTSEHRLNPEAKEYWKQAAPQNMIEFANWLATKLSNNSQAMKKGIEDCERMRKRLEAGETELDRLRKRCEELESLL